MLRVQLAVEVADIDRGGEALLRAVRQQADQAPPGYANFAIADPRLVLIENPVGRRDGVAGALNHLGVGVGGPDEVRAATVRVTGHGLEGVGTRQPQGVPESPSTTRTPEPPMWW